MRSRPEGAAGTLRYLLADHLGSSSVVTDSAGAVVGTAKYYPYGEARAMTGAVGTDKLFTGQQYESPPAWGPMLLYNYGARFYSPLTGRFVSPDPLLVDALALADRPLRREEQSDDRSHSVPKEHTKAHGRALVTESQLGRGREPASHQLRDLLRKTVEEVSPNLGLPSARNAYTYVENCPLKLVDPSGKLGFFPSPFEDNETPSVIKMRCITWFQEWDLFRARGLFDTVMLFEFQLEVLYSYNTRTGEWQVLQVFAGQVHLGGKWEMTRISTHITREGVSAFAQFKGPVAGLDDVRLRQRATMVSGTSGNHLIVSHSVDVAGSLGNVGLANASGGSCTTIPEGQ